MSIKKLSWIFAALVIFTGAVAAQDQKQAQPEKVIKHVPVKPTSAASGKEGTKRIPQRGLIVLISDLLDYARVSSQAR